MLVVIVLIIVKLYLLRKDQLLVIQIQEILLTYLLNQINLLVVQEELLQKEESGEPKGIRNGLAVDAPRNNRRLHR